MLTYMVIVPLVISVFLYLFPMEKLARVVSIATQLALFVAAYRLFMATWENDVVVTIGHYYDVLGIMLRADMLSSVFILLTTFIFLLVAIYSFNEEKSRLFWFLLFIWEGLIIGIFLANDLFNIFVLTEVATIVVTVIIMYDRENRSMYDGIIYFMINMVVVQFYLLGLGYIYRMVGVLDIDAATYGLATLDQRQLMLPYALIMTFIGLKCAMMPVFSWLPKAHSTPGASPAASAILSGLHIKSGVYLFLRFEGLFAAVDSSLFFLGVGIITAIVGIVFALAQQNIKRVLAYSTIAQIGLIFAGLSLGGVYNHMGSVFHMINHAIFKVGLFLSAGVIVHAYGTKDLNKIRGVLKSMPVVGFATIPIIFGIAGMPLFNASVSKYFLMYGLSGFLNLIFIAINLGTIMIFIKFSAILFGKVPEDVKPVKNDICQQVPIITLGLLCFVFGVFGEQVIYYFLNWEGQMYLRGYIQKSVIFAVSVIVGYFLLKYVVQGRAIFTRIRDADLGFRGMCAAIGVFFAAFLIVTGF